MIAIFLSLLSEERNYDVYDIYIFCYIVLINAPAGQGRGCPIFTHHQRRGHPTKTKFMYIHLRTTEHIIISVGISQNDTAMKSAQADFDIQGIIYYYYLIKFNVRIEPLGYGRLIIHSFASLVAPLHSTFILALHGL